MNNQIRVVSNLTNRQRDELARVGRIPRMYDVGRLTFQYDAATGMWRQWQQNLQFLTAGVGENFGANVGILTTETIQAGQNSLDDGGFPSKEFSFLVKGITFEFGLPYVPSSDNGSDETVNLRVSSFGALSLNTQDIAEYLIRAGLTESYVQYVTRNCTFELGPTQEMPSGIGVNDPKGGPSAFGVQMGNRSAPLLRRDPLILPPSDPKYSTDYKIVLNLQAGAATASFPVPAALSSGAAPDDNDIVAIPVRLLMDGVYGITDTDGAFQVADEVEAAILDDQLAQAA